MENSLLKTVRTPAYVFSVDELLARVQMLRVHLGPAVRIIFAVKANPFLIGPLLDAADGFEVCSPGEVRLCIKAGVPPEKLILSGVNKEADVYADFVRQFRDAPVYTVESERQMNLLNTAALQYESRLRVLLRRSGGNQFGMDESTLRALAAKADHYPGLCITGIQQYTGTQKKPVQILRELDRFDTFLCSLPDAFLTEAEFGPGLPVSYFMEEDDIPEEKVLEQLADRIGQMRFPGQLTLEIGRFLSAPCGYYLTSIADLKCSDDAYFAITDGGIHQLNYYQQFMGMKLPHMHVLRRTGSADHLPADSMLHYTVCGSLCTSSDILVRDFPAPALNIGDVLVFERTGAYSVTEGISLFLSRDLPGVYLSEHGHLTKIRDITRTEAFNC